MKVSSISLVATCVLMVQGQTPTTAGAGPTTAGPTTYSPPATGELVWYKFYKQHFENVPYRIY